MRFCGLGPGDAVSDANTLWDCREALIAAGARDEPFARLEQEGVLVREGGEAGRAGRHGESRRRAALS